jgi:hypothetical protein
MPVARFTGKLTRKLTGKVTCEAMAKSYRKQHLEAQRKHQATYRQRMREVGWREVTVWLDQEAAKVVNGLRGMKLSVFISKAVCSPKHEVTRDIPSDIIGKVTRDKPGRYMSVELEDKILQIREDGMSFKEVAHRLAEEGVVDATGKPYRTGTLSKAAQRAR